MSILIFNIGTKLFLMIEKVDISYGECKTDKLLVSLLNCINKVTLRSASEVSALNRK